MSLPVVRLTATDCNAAACANSSNDDGISKVKDLENVIETFMKKQNEQIKEITEIITVSASQVKLPSAAHNTLKESENLDTPRTKKRKLAEAQTVPSALCTPCC